MRILSRDEARQAVREEWREILDQMTPDARLKVNGERSWVCPLCGHGTNGDGLTVNKRIPTGAELKCFGCGFSGDIISLYEKTRSCDFSTALQDLCRMQDVEIRREEKQNAPLNWDGTPQAPAGEKQAAGREINTGTDKTPQRGSESVEDGHIPFTGENEVYADVSAYCETCAKLLQTDLGKPGQDYLQRRGISLKTAESLGIGFDPQADPAGSGHQTPRIIIPTSKTNYIGRAISPDVAKNFQKMNNKGSKVALFNGSALYSGKGKAVFIVEGWADAASIAEIGYPAVALNSTSNTDLIIQALKSKATESTLVLSLDTDSKGVEASEKLSKALEEIDADFITANISGSYKDASEALEKDRDSFIVNVETAVQQTSPRPDNIADYMDRAMRSDVERFRKEIPTGFYVLDTLAGGGLHCGLYVVAAVSTLGKTTLCAQMADQIAAAGTDVLFFSLEMSRLEMVSKSIARTMAKHDMKTAQSSLAIRKGNWNPATMNAAGEHQSAVGSRMSVIEGNFDTNVSFIGHYIRKYIRNTGTSPVVFLDYLQVLQPDPGCERMDVRSMTDHNIEQLKRLSRNLGIAIVVISSVNRANYTTPIDFEALKESGCIEYTADCIWGLQYACLSEEMFDKDGKVKEKRERIEKAMDETPRHIMLKSLKNRYGKARFTVSFNYFSANDLFVEESGQAAPKPAARKAVMRI